MGEIFMSAGILTAIILCLVGIVKLPFTKFKANKPKLFKATFTTLSIVLSVLACVLTQLYILNGKILSTNFTILLLSTIAGVFGLYSSYEGLGLKNLIKRLINKLQELKESAPESKFAKYINKLGVDKANELVAKRQEEIIEEEKAKAEAEAKAKADAEAKAKAEAEAKAKADAEAKAQTPTSEA